MKRIESRKAADIEGWEDAVEELGRDSFGKMVTNPILFAMVPPAPRPEGPKAHGYLTFAPKTFCRVLRNAAGEFKGICAFSRDACGPPSMAHGGAIAALLDNVMGVCTIELDRTTTLTRSFAVKYRRPVPIEEVLTLSCKTVEQPATKGKEPSAKRRKRLFVEGEIRSGPHSKLYEEGELLVSATAVFTKTGMEFVEEEVYSQSVETSWKLGPPEGFDYEDLTCLPWGAQAEALAIKLAKTHRRFNFREELPELIDETTGGMIGYGEGCTPFEMSDLPPPGSQFFTGKLRALNFYDDGLSGGALCPSMASIVHFSGLCGGPPGRANGGATLAAFDVCLSFFVMRRSGWVPAGNTTYLQVDFLKGVPLGCNALIICVDSGRLAFSSLGMEPSLMDKVAFDATPRLSEGALARAEAEARERGEIPCDAFLFVSKNADGFELCEKDRATPAVDFADFVLAARARATFKRPRGVQWMDYHQSNAHVRSLLSEAESSGSKSSTTRSKL